MDPAAAGGDGDGDGSGTAGIGGARVRLTKAVRRHPKLAAALPPAAATAGAAAPVAVADPGAVGVAPLAVRAEWVRGAIRRLATESPPAAVVAAVSAAAAVWDNAPARAAELAGTPLAAQWADTVAAVAAAAAAHLASRLHAPTPTAPARLAPMLHHIAERYAAADAAVVSAAAAATAGAATAAHAGSSRAAAANAMRAAADNSLTRATLWLGDAFAAASAVFDPHDAPLLSAIAAMVGLTFSPFSVVPCPPPPSNLVRQFSLKATCNEQLEEVGRPWAMVHVAWERALPRAPSAAAAAAAAPDCFTVLGVDAAADAAWARASLPLRRFLAAAFIRRALQRSRPGGSGGIYAPGVIAAAVGSLRAVTRLFVEADRVGSVPETCAEVLPLLMGPLLEAVAPPAPPPNPARSAPPLHATAAAPAVRAAVYRFLRMLVATHPR